MNVVLASCMKTTCVSTHNWLRHTEIFGKRLEGVRYSVKPSVFGVSGDKVRNTSKKIKESIKKKALSDSRKIVKTKKGRQSKCTVLCRDESLLPPRCDAVKKHERALSLSGAWFIVRFARKKILDYAAVAESSENDS